FGYLAFAIPLLVMTKLVLLVRKTARTDGLFWLTRSGGLLLSLSMLCVLAEMSIWQGDALPAGAGGILGQWLVSLLLPLFSFAGTAVVVAGLLALGLMLYLEFSWLQLFDRLGGWLLQRLQKQPQAAVDQSPAEPMALSDYEEPALLATPVLEKTARTGLFSRRDRAEPSLGNNSAAAEEGSEPPLLLDTLAADADDRNDDDELLPWDDEP